MAPRRARRASASQRARNTARAQQRGLQELADNARKATARAIQDFAVRSMNSLAQAGPAWSGKFSASWGFAPEGVAPNTPGTTGRIYRYTKNDVSLRDVERYIRDGVTRFSIVNTAPHAAIAIDEEEATFFPPAYQIDPIKTNIEYGTGRPSTEHLRWQIRNEPGEDITSQITAPKDWFPNYVKGGGLQGDLSKAFAVSFRVD